LAEIVSGHDQQNDEVLLGIITLSPVKACGIGSLPPLARERFIGAADVLGARRLKPKKCPVTCTF